MNQTLLCSPGGGRGGGEMHQEAGSCLGGVLWGPAQSQTGGGWEGFPEEEVSAET